MNLSGWWPLNEQQGSIAHDLSGNGNSGNIINGTWSQPNYVAQFDGQTSYVQMNLSLAGMSPGTVSAWVYPQSNGVIFQDGIYIGGDGDPLLLVLNKNMNASLDINNGAWVIDKGNIALAKNKWYMVTGTWTGDTMSLYVDGLTDNSVTFGFSVTPETCATCIYSALGYSSWGNKGNPSLQEQYTGGSTPFAGRMANVQVYGTALTASQVYSLYQEGIAGPPITSANAIGWYPLNGDTIDRAKSYNELVYNGAIVGNLQFVSPSSSVRSSPSNTTSVFTANFIASKLPYVTGNAPQINTAAGGFNTVSFWMDWPGNTNMMPFSFGSYDFWLNSDTCAGFNTFNSDVYGFNPSSIVNRWVFVTATFINNEPYTNNNLIYINGARQTLSQCGGTQAIRSATNNYQISGNNGDTYTFVGQLANFQIYNTSLTQSQINQLYSEGIAGSPLSANLVAWYPLDGNANDYSGNGNTGIQVKMQYSTVAASAGTENMNMPSSLSHISSEFQTIGLLNPQAAPPPIVLYEPIQLYNAQTAATPNPFQYMLTVDSATYSSYEASNLQNIEFFYPNGTVIPSWLESCSTTCSSSGSSTTSTEYWLKLTSPIPAGGYAYIYMGFAPTSINMFNGANTGEAPQLSPTYAEYDDGKNVFTNYWNFAGTSLPSGWTTSSSLTASVNNGVTLTSSATGQYLGYSSAITSPFIFEIYGKVTTATTDASNLLALLGSSLGTATDWTGEAYVSGDVLSYGIAGAWTSTSSAWSADTFYLNGVWLTSSGVSDYVNYNLLGSSTSSGGLSSAYLMVWQDASTTFVQWVRTRAYPPSGVMPSATFLLGSNVGN